MRRAPVGGHLAMRAKSKYYVFDWLGSREDFTSKRVAFAHAAMLSRLYRRFGCIRYRGKVIALWQEGKQVKG